MDSYGCKIQTVFPQEQTVGEKRPSLTVTKQPGDRFGVPFSRYRIFVLLHS